MGNHSVSVQFQWNRSSGVDPDSFGIKWREKQSLTNNYSRNMSSIVKVEANSTADLFIFDTLTEA